MRRLRSSAQRRGTLGIALCGALLGTLFALVAGAVKFGSKRGRKTVNIIVPESVSAQ